MSSQLVESLELLSLSPLTPNTLSELKQFEESNHVTQGVYLLYYQGNPVYLGKADDVAERLEQHFFKLSGRKNITLDQIGYKSILLDTSMGTAANEEILIRMFSQNHSGMWNGSGFGSKDPGKERDKTRPGRFDQTYPINEHYKIDFYGTNHTIKYILETSKRHLPFVFRFDIPQNEQSKEVNLPQNPISAEDLLIFLVNELGEGWQGTLLSFGITLYKKIEEYPFGRVIRSG